MSADFKQNKTVPLGQILPKIWSFKEADFPEKGQFSRFQNMFRFEWSAKMLKKNEQN